MENKSLLSLDVLPFIINKNKTSKEIHSQLISIGIIQWDSKKGWIPTKKANDLELLTDDGEWWIPAVIELITKENKNGNK